MWFRFVLIILFILPSASVYCNEPIGNKFNKSYALVVGIDKYISSNWGDLKYAVKDARGIESFLQKQKFIVKTLYNEQATREKIVGYLENELAQVAGKNDRFIFFFAGHGHTEFFSASNERGYLVPYDGKDTSATYLAMSRIRDLSEILETVRHQLFIIDSCYGGKLGSRGELVSLDPRISQYLEEVVKRKARQILTAGGATQRVQDTGPDGHSVFTGELLNALNEGLGDTDGDGYISFYELALFIKRAASRSNQTPGVDYLNGHQQGEFVFDNPKMQNKPAVFSPSESSNPNTMRGRPVYEIMKEAKGKFVEEDKYAALALFRQASELGNIEAMFFQGLILFDSKFFSPEENQEGLQLVRESAERGHIPAMEALRDYYKQMSKPREVEHWEQQISEAEFLMANASLVDPTGGEAQKGEPDIPEEALRLPSAPKGFRIIQ